MDGYEKIDELLGTTCYVIDILPQRVEKDSAGQFFAIEQYFLKQTPLNRIYQKFADILLKLNCYHDFMALHGEQWHQNPTPETLGQWIFQAAKNRNGSLTILLENGNSMLTVNNDNLFMTLYNPSNDLLTLVARLAESEGLFVCQSM